MKDWFDDSPCWTYIIRARNLEYNNNAFMAKMWNAQEMAKDITEQLTENDGFIEGDAYHYGIHKFSYRHLAQILKKEWFR